MRLFAALVCLMCLAAPATAQRALGLTALSPLAEDLATTCAPQLTAGRREMLKTYTAARTDQIISDTLETAAKFDRPGAQADLTHSKAIMGPPWAKAVDDCVDNARIAQIDRSVQRTAPKALSANEASGCIEFATGINVSRDQPRLQGLLLNHCDFRVSAMWCLDKQDCASGFSYRGDIAPGAQVSLPPAPSGDYDAKWAACHAGPGFAGDAALLARMLQHVCN